MVICYSTPNKTGMLRIHAHNTRVHNFHLRRETAYTTQQVLNSECCSLDSPISLCPEVQIITFSWSIYSLPYGFWPYLYTKIVGTKVIRGSINKSNNEFSVLNFCYGLNVFPLNSCVKVLTSKYLATFGERAAREVIKVKRGHQSRVLV